MTSTISTLLKPLAAYYDDPTAVEVRMVAPGAVTIDRRGVGKKKLPAPELTLAKVENLCRTLSNFTNMKFDPHDHPKLSCVIPEVRHRFECLVGPSVQSGLSMTIRCKHPFVPTWEQLGIAPEVVAYLEKAVLAESNLIVSGATNTGKTTLLNKLLHFLPAERRVIAIEDTPELEIDRFWDGVGLLAAREASTANGMIDWRQIYDHLMRATPDHPIFGEISTQNAFAALAALNSGMTGVMMTIHAESPKQVIHRKFAQNIAWAGHAMPEIPEFLTELVDVIVQIKRGMDGYRRITDIYEPRKDVWVMRHGVMHERTAA